MFYTWRSSYKKYDCKQRWFLFNWLGTCHYGDLAYELAIHFILIEYNEQEKSLFLDKFVKVIDLDMEKLINDIKIYTVFELYRRKV